jgi:hypothetical protein
MALDIFGDITNDKELSNSLSTDMEFANKVIKSIDIVKLNIGDIRDLIDNEIKQYDNIKDAGIVTAMLTYSAAATLLIPSMDALDSVKDIMASARKDIEMSDTIIEMIHAFTNNPITLAAIASKLCVNCLVILGNEIPGLERLL